MQHLYLQVGECPNTLHVNSGDFLAKVLQIPNGLRGGITNRAQRLVDGFQSCTGGAQKGLQLLCG